MEIYIKEKLCDLNGEEIKNDKTPALLGDVCIVALTTDVHGENQEPGNKKFHRWQLANRITKALRSDDQTMDIQIEDLDLIKKRIAMACPTRILGPAYQLLERSNT